MSEKYISLTVHVTDLNGNTLHVDFQGLDPISAQFDNDRTFVSCIHVFSNHP
jgi:hypothetical protein